MVALLHSTLVVDVSQTLQRWTEGATYIRQGDHHVGHWPTFLVNVHFVELCMFLPVSPGVQTVVCWTWCPSITPSASRTFYKTSPTLTSTICRRSLNPAWSVLVTISFSGLVLLDMLWQLLIDVLFQTHSLVPVSEVMTACAGSIVMVTLCNRADHYIFALWFLSFFFFFLA